MENLYSYIQARPRMRIPKALRHKSLPIYVISAIDRHPEIDEEGLYGQALEGLRHGNNARAFSNFRKVVEKKTSGAPLNWIDELLAEELLTRGLSQVDEHTWSTIYEFNRRYLNDKGMSALLTLLTFDAADLDPLAIDAFRGGEALAATYGPRKTRPAKELGRQIQIRIKGMESSDEPATEEAADCYVEYRYLYDGSFSDYFRDKQLEGTDQAESHYRKRFGKFDKALGFPPPKRGRRPSR